VIDARPLEYVPVYITEWNRATATSGSLSANEQVSADFLRQSLLDVDVWNRTPGNHNIRAMAWFVAQDYGDGAWSQYALEWRQTRGNPVGHPGDLWTALLDSSQLQAGMSGTRPEGVYDGNGVVDLNDWHEWKAAFGRTDWPFADGNRNGIVDAADYTLWRDSLTNAGAGSGPFPIPEAAAIWHLLWGIAGLLAHRACWRCEFVAHDSCYNGRGAAAQVLASTALAA
jgi:hypothetical protein